MKRLAEAISRFISEEELLKPGDRLGLAVSGGSDSVAMLRLLLELRAELGIVLAVLHFNHRLRGDDSDADQEFVNRLSQRHGLEFFCGSRNAALWAEERGLGLEVAARSLRYKFFSKVMRDARLNRVATAHTLDDQAETVLLKLSRGAGTRGLAGIYPKLTVNQSPANDYENVIIRPLLKVRRRELESYLFSIGQSWREDKSNRDLRHMRNVVRHGILPRLERNLNPSVREALADTAEIARAEEEYWTARVSALMPNLIKLAAGDDSSMLDTDVLSAQPVALQRRAIRAFAELSGSRLEFKHVEHVRRLASAGHKTQSVQLPGGWIVSRGPQGISFASSPNPKHFDYEYALTLPGEVAVPEAGKLIRALVVSPAEQSAYNLDHAIDPALLANGLHVRNWRAGDRFWPGHSKSPKKIKRLLQERHISKEDRKLMPIVASGDQVVWVEGYATPKTWRPADSAREIVIIEGSNI
jgi:tRNA(Ile)-lysidine synthase